MNIDFICALRIIRKGGTEEVCYWRKNEEQERSF